MVNTFVPFSDIHKCAKALDYRRLGKQRVEAYQLWRALQGLTKGWVNHPATLMWKGHTCFLAMYCNAMIDEWIARGYDYYHFDVGAYADWGYVWPSKVQFEYRIKNPEPDKVCTPL
jgi:hypothetical protein